MSNSFEKLNRVPPVLPIVWHEFNPLIRTMNMTQRGVYFSMMLHQWLYDSLPWDAWQLPKAIGAEYKTCRKFLEKFSDLTVCVQCSSSYRPATVHCSCSDRAVTMHNEKLKNYKIDVNSKVPLGTTEPNPTSTEGNGTSPSADAVPPPTGGGEKKKNSGSSLDDDFDQDPLEPNPLVDELVARLGMARPPVPKLYREWARKLNNLVDGYGVARYQKGIAYLFENAYFGRGIKATKEGKVAWLCSKWEAVLTQMDADKEFGKKTSSAARANDNRPEYLSKPSGNVSFGKSVI
jgi:hypothetical protein